MTTPDLPLRQVKAARTKLALLDAFLAELSRRPFEEITVSELCAAVEISNATFFNYFAKKSDLLLYFVQLWSVEVSAVARAAERERGGLPAIEAIFEHTAALCERNPEVMGEVLAYLATRRESGAPRLPSLSEAEKRLRFPDIDDFQGLAEGGLGTVFTHHLESALAAGALPAGVDIGEVGLALAVIFQGVPIALSTAGARHYAAAYRRQLNLLWTGLQAQFAKGVTS